MSSLIRNRLDSVPFKNGYRVLDDTCLALVLTWIEPLMTRIVMASSNIGRYNRTSIADVAGDEARVALRRIDPGLGDSVVAIWPRDKSAAALDREDFLSFFDDLWFPGADDLWLIDVETKRFLLIDHEENLIAGEIF